MVVSHPVDNKVSLALEPSLYVLGSLVTLACFDMFGLCSKLQITRFQHGLCMHQTNFADGKQSSCQAPLVCSSCHMMLYGM